MIDDATRSRDCGWTWVDDVSLEYEACARNGWGARPDAIVKVSAVSVNHAAREIHVNTPQPVMLSITLGKTPREASACDECCEEAPVGASGSACGYRCWVRRDEKP
jgi:hypothetical protein